MYDRPRLTRSIRQFTDLDADRDLRFRAEDKRKAQISRVQQLKRQVH